MKPCGQHFFRGQNLQKDAGRAGNGRALMAHGVMQAQRLMKASRIDVASAEHDLQDDEDGLMSDPDGVLRAVELFRQQRREQQARDQQAASGRRPQTS